MPGLNFVGVDASKFGVIGALVIVAIGFSGLVWLMAKRFVDYLDRSQTEQRLEREHYAEEYRLEREKYDALAREERNGFNNTILANTQAMNRMVVACQKTNMI